MAPSAATVPKAAGAPSISMPSSLLSRPSKWLHAYDGFIAKNLGQVSQIESTLRSLTYIIPGRFRDAEIASEAIHSGVQLLSLYHDLLLQRTSGVVLSSSSSFMPSAPKYPSDPLHVPSQHSRYTRFWTQKSPFYRRVAVVLQVVRYTELLCEMAAKRRGERMRWRVIVLIEAIKAVCRLLLLRVTRGRTLLSPALPVRQPLPEAEDEEDEMMEEEETGENGAKEPDQEASTRAQADSFFRKDGTPDATAIQKSLLSPQPPLSPPPSPTPSKSTTAAVQLFATSPTPITAPPSLGPTLYQSSPKRGWSMPRTGMSLPPLPQPGDISSYLLTRVLTADDIKPATKLLNQLHGSSHTAEVLQILAPLVFAVALARSSSRRTAWAPWMAGLFMECAARQLRDRNSLRTTTLERDEWNRRGWSMGWWAMRGPFYEHLMKGVVTGVRSRMPGFLGGILEDYEYLWENYYFSTSP